MARNEEKAQAMLNRWWSMKRDLHKRHIIRPKGQLRIQKIESLGDCEKWRNSILKEINKKVIIIQNAGLGEHKIRELNDEINNLIKEKSQWEERIQELGGPNYKKIISERLADAEGYELPGLGGYKYFGAAKDLPGVRDLFLKQKPEAPKKSMVDYFRNIDLDHYLGKKITDEKKLIEHEKQIEDQWQKKEIERWMQENAEIIKRKFKKEECTSHQDILKLIDELDQEKDEQDIKDQQQKMVLENEQRDDDDEDEQKNEKKEVNLTPQEIEKRAILEEKKKQLLEKLNQKDDQSQQ